MGLVLTLFNIVFVFVFVFVFTQSQVHALSRSETRLRSSQRNQGYLHRDYESYQYSSCKPYNDEKTESYFAYCTDGRIDYLPIRERRISSLELPSKILRKQDLEQELLAKIKSEVSHKMNEQLHRVRLHYQCLKHSNNDARISRYCRNIINGHLESTKTYLPQMRESMAVMQTSYTSVVSTSHFGIHAGRLSGVEVEDDIEHPNYDHDIPALTQEEESTINLKRLNQRQYLEDEFFKQSNTQKKCKDKKARGSLICQTTTVPQLNNHIRSQENKVIDESKKYYESIISQYPHLPYIRQAKFPNNRNDQITLVRDAMKELYDQAKSQYEQWESAPLEDYKSFFHYPKIVESILDEKYEFSKINCDLLEGLHQEYGPGGSGEILRNIGIAAGTLIGGGICVFTGGLACAVGVAIVGEAMTIIPEHEQLSLTQQLYRGGIVNADEVNTDRDNRNLSMAMAPLSFVGLKGAQSVRSSSRAITSGLSSISDEIFDLTRPLSKAHLDELLSYQATNPAINRKWIEMAKAGHSGDALFFDVENAAMKKLNDSLGDKNLVTSLTNLHKTLMQKEVSEWIKKYPDLQLDLYSDFKSIRFALGGEISSELKAQLKREFSELTARVNRQFKVKVDSMDGKIPSGTSSADSWFKAGMGNSADQAGLAARKSRESRDLSAVDIDQLRDRIKSELGDIEELRRKVERELSAQLIDGDNNIPNIDIIEFVRKKGSLHESDPVAFRSAFKNRFNSELTDQQADDLVGYLKQVDQFSPGLWLEERVIANLDDAEFGGFSADFKGMGAKNLQQVAIDLSKNPNSLDQTLSSLRKGEGLVTESFDSSKNWYRDVVTKTLNEDGIKTRNLCSGDDCVSIPTQALPDLTKEKIMRALVKYGAPDGQRLSFIPPGIHPSQRSLLAVHGELIEKQVRNHLTGFSQGQLSPEILKKMAIAIDMPDKVGSGSPRLMISTASDLSLTPAQRETISNAYSEIMKKVNEDIAQETGKDTVYDSGQLIWVAQ